MTRKHEIAKLLDAHKARKGRFIQWLSFSSQKEAEDTLVAIKKEHMELRGIGDARVRQTEDRKAWQFGLTHDQWVTVVEHHQAAVKEDKFTTQLRFVDYFIRNRRADRDHPEVYQRRIALIGGLATQQHVYFRREFLPVYIEGHHRDHLKLGYQPNRSADYDPGQIELAPDAVHAHFRHYTKYRMVYGPVPYYFDDFDEAPVLIDTISACAVNLMGSSRADEERFMPGGRLDARAYQEECRASAEFLLSVAKLRGANKFVMPAFGVGVYIKNLKNDADKARAKEIMNIAFAEMAQKFQILVDWVVYQHAPNAMIEKGFLDRQTEGNPYMHHVITDLMGYTREQNQTFHCVLLNPGSDRTIGGAYTTKDPHTLEEKIAQNSDLLFLHTVYNEGMMDRFEKELDACIKLERAAPASTVEALATARPDEVSRRHASQFFKPPCVEQMEDDVDEKPALT